VRQNYRRYVAVIIHAAHVPCVKNRQRKRGRYQTSAPIINGVGDQKVRDS
jgi:hypothetical protein